jgi:hypothetical protein
LAGIFYTKWVRICAWICVPTLLLVGAYFWVTTNKNLMWALTRGSVNRTSTSTEPYDVILRIASKDNIAFPDGVPPKEWVLRLPRNYVTVENGKNGSVHIAGGPDETYYSVGFDANVGADGMSFTPSVGKTKDQLVIRSMLLRLRNDEANPITAVNDLCLPQDKNEEILRPLGRDGYNRDCTKENLRCDIEMQIDGWWLDIGVTQDLYKDPVQTCALARTFLETHTIKRDDLRK